MAYDETLATRIRAQIKDHPHVSEKKMFGGLAFLVSGNMAIAASAQGGIMVRVDPAQSDQLVSSTPAHVVEMRGRLMPGWLRVNTADAASDSELSTWIERGYTYAAALPPKPDRP